MTVPWLFERDLISIMSLLSFILLLIPVTWHIRSLWYCSIGINKDKNVNLFVAWNIGYLLASFWVGWLCFMTFINSVIWRGNITNWAPAFCDISKCLFLSTKHGRVSEIHCPQLSESHMLPLSGLLLQAS